MALTNSEYNLIMREYEKRRYAARHELEARIKEVNEKIPRIREIQREMSEASLENMKNRLAGKKEGDNCTREQLHIRIQRLTAEKKRLLRENGYDGDFLKMRYACPECRDTGYVGNDKCRCLKAKIVELLYMRSNIKEILEKENFSSFKLSLYSDKFVDKGAKQGALSNIRNVLKKSKAFVSAFGDGCENLFIYGETGVGKTFLTNCIAKELMDRGRSVIYVSAVNLFELLAEEQFGKADRGEDGASGELMECELLIIDDLGTELVNSFTASALFNCLNARYLRKKPVIISTNLSLGDIRDIYSERIFSRIASNYIIMKIFGEDLRLVTSLGLRAEERQVKAVKPY